MYFFPPTLPVREQVHWRGSWGTVGVACAHAPARRGGGCRRGARAVVGVWADAGDELRRLGGGGTAGLGWAVSGPAPVPASWAAVS